MKDKKTAPPPVGTPEFREWFREQSAKDINDIFGDNYKPADFEENGAIFRDIADIDKTDTELFPDELEKYSAENYSNYIK